MLHGLEPIFSKDADVLVPGPIAWSVHAGNEFAIATFNALHLDTCGLQSRMPGKEQNL